MKGYIASILVAWLIYAPGICWGLPANTFYRRPSAAPPTSNPINHAVFGGSQYLRASGITPTGLVNGKAGTVAGWAKFSGADGVGQALLSISAPATIMRFYVGRATTTDRLVVLAYNTPQQVILEMRGTTALNAAFGWFQYAIVFDLTNSSLCKMYINGVEETLTVKVVTNDWIAWAETTNTRITIGGNQTDSPGNLLVGAQGELWFNDTRNDVIGDYYNAGLAVPLGSNGEAPIGSQPVLYMSSSGSGNSWSNNGSAGALTRTGTLNTDAEPPDWTP